MLRNIHDFVADIDGVTAYNLIARDFMSVATHCVNQRTN